MVKSHANMLGIRKRKNEYKDKNVSQNIFEKNSRSASRRNFCADLKEQMVFDPDQNYRFFTLLKLK